MDQPDAAPPEADERFRRIELVTDAALAHLDPDELMAELLDRVREALEVDTAAVLLLDPSGTQLIAAAARGLEEEVRQGVRVPVGEGFAGRVSAERRAVILDRVDDTTVRNPILFEKGVKSLLGVPLVAHGTMIGVLHVGTLSARAFGPEDAHFLQVVADRVALATQSQLSEGDRSASVALQRSLLPARLPDIPGLRLAARYAAGEDVGVGGDWYDVLTLPDGHVGLVVGDVAGHGLRAAVVMGRLRSALRAYALETTEPGEALHRLDRKLQHFEPGEFATALYAVFDPSLDRVSLASAGHPPLILATPGERARRVEMASGYPLGVSLSKPRKTCTFDTPEGTVLCAYTDGLIERRGRSLDVGLAQLERVVTVGDPRDVCAAVMSRLVGSDRLRDDVAILVAQRTVGPHAAAGASVASGRSRGRREMPGRQRTGSLSQ
jgi:sigma-B regulation protein RsbU (phosphoserine phosphatase)